MRLAISNAGLEWRGTDTDTEILTRGLTARGHEVLNICRPDSAIWHKLHAEFPMAPVLGGLDFDPRAILRARKVLKRHRIELLITQKDKDMRLTAIAAWTLGIPVLVRHVTDRPLKSAPHYRFLYSTVATHHLANSQATLETLRKSAPWLKADVPVVPNGIDVEAIANAQPADLQLPSDAVVVGFIGAFETRKGIFEFAQAWPHVAAAVPNAHAVIAGKGARESEFKAALNGQPRVHWLGFRRDVAQVMRALDIFVMASRFEGFGLVLAEAMAAGAAPVAFDASNIPEMVEDGVTGRLAEAGNPMALAQAIAELANDPGRRKKLGQAAQVYARQEFTADLMVARHETLLREWLGGR